MLSNPDGSAGKLNYHALGPRSAAERRRNGDQNEPWSPGELSRLLASARTMPDDNAPRSVPIIPARHFWPGLLCGILATAAKSEVMLATPREAFNFRAGTLAVGYYVFQLHPIAFAAIAAAARHDDPLLLPWHLDGRKPPYFMLFRRMKLLLWRAGLPPVSRNLFERLRITAREVPDIIDDIDPCVKFSPRPGRPPDVRRRNNRRFIVKAKSSKADDAPAYPPPKPAAPQLKSRRGRSAIETRRRREAERLGVPQLVTITIDRPDTLRRFFEERYRPLRLLGSPEKTLNDYRRTLDRLRQLLGRDALVSDLSDNLIDSLLTSKLYANHGPAARNRYRACLLALWRHAWRKRLADELPRDVEKFKEPKRLPEAWSLEEFWRIVEHAGYRIGRLGGVPERHYWPALLMTLFYTGLRINALRLRAVTDLDANGWLSVPAEDQKQRADQKFKLPEGCLAASAATDPHTRDLLFPTPWLGTSWKPPILARLKAILKSAALPHGRRDMFHKLRRTHATHLANETDLATAQKSLGHANVSTTLGYIDWRYMTNHRASADFLPRPPQPEFGKDET